MKLRYSFWQRSLGILLLGLILLTACPVMSAAEANHFALFESTAYLANLTESYSKSSANFRCVFQYTTFFCNDDGVLYGRWDAENRVFIEGEEGYWDRSYPADKLEALAHKVLDFDGTLKQLLEKSDDDTYLYDNAGNRFICTLGGMGSPDRYELRGYTQNADGTYAAYCQFHYGYLELTDLESMRDSLVSVTVDYNDELYTGSIDEILSRVEANPAMATEGYFTGWSKRWAKITIALEDGYPKVLQLERTETAPSLDGMITSAPQEPEYDVDEGITVKGDGAFSENTVVVAKATDENTALQTAKQALAEIVTDDRMVVFSLTATENGAAVQPNGTVLVTFPIPQNLSLEGLRLFYVAENGQKEELAITVNAEARTVSAELTHFSLYVLCNAKEGVTIAPAPSEDTPNGTSPAPNASGSSATKASGNGAAQGAEANGQTESRGVSAWLIVGIVAAVLLAAGGGVFLFLYLKKRKKNA